MKPTLILLHGLFGGLSNWKAVIEYYSSGYDIHAPGIPLFDVHKEDELDYLSCWLERYIDEAGLNDVTLIGNSLGGHIAILYTHRHPTNVRALVLTGSSGLFEHNILGRYPRRHDYAYIRERVESTFYDPATATDELVDVVFETVGDTFKCLRIVSNARATQRSHVTELLPQIDLPALLLWGEEDQITPVHVAKEFHGLLPNARLVLFQECGHAPMMEKPDAFNRALGAFLQEV